MAANSVQVTFFKTIYLTGAIHSHQFMSCESGCAPRISLIITGDNDVKAEKIFNTTSTLDLFRQKLISLFGFSCDDAVLVHYGCDNQLIGMIEGSDGKATLKELGLGNFHRIHVCPVGFKKAAGLFDRNDDFTDTSLVPKFELTDEEYSQKEETFRNWKAKMLPKASLSTMMSDNNGASEDWMKFGSRCIVNSNNFKRKGTIKWKGTLKGKESEGLFVGVSLDEPLGLHNGTLLGVTYFTCEKLHGTFVKANFVTPIVNNDDRDELNDDDAMDEL